MSDHLNPRVASNTVLRLRFKKIDPFIEIAFFDSVSGPAVAVNNLPDGISDEQIETILNVPETPQEQAAVENFLNSKSRIDNIPGWSTWDESQALAWGNDNIEIPLVAGRTNLPATLTFAATRLAILAILDILDAMWIFQKTAIRILVALRDKNWPNIT